MKFSDLSHLIEDPKTLLIPEGTCPVPQGRDAEQREDAEATGLLGFAQTLSV